MDLAKNIIWGFAEIILNTVKYILDANTVGDLAMRLVAIIGSYSFFVLPIGRWIYANIIENIQDWYSDISINFYAIGDLFEIQNYLNIIKWILLTIFILFFSSILTVATVVFIILYLALFLSIIMFFVT